MKTYCLVHGRDGSCEKDWFPWLKKKLEEQGNKVVCCQMPNSQTPEIVSRVDTLQQYVEGIADNELYFVGHSIGCQTILRYMQKTDKHIAGCVFVAPWLNLIPTCIPDKASKRIAQPWIQTPINLEYLKQRHTPMIALFSDNDYCVALDQAQIFVEKLNAKTFVFHEKGHFTTDDGVDTLPEVLTILSNA